MDDCLSDILYYLNEYENGPGLHYNWDSVCIEDLEGALYNMQGAIADLRKYWWILVYSYGAAYELGYPVLNLENYEQCRSMSLSWRSGVQLSEMLRVE